MLRPSGPITIGSDTRGGDAFSGYIHSLRLYDRALKPDEVRANYELKSDTQDKIEIDWNNIAVKTEVLTPTLVKVSVTDKEGAPLHSGQLHFAYGVRSGNQEKSNLPQMSQPANLSATLLTTDGKPDQTVFVTISDDDGKSTNYVQAVNIDTKAFNIFTDDFKAFHEWDGKYVTNDKVKYETFFCT